MDLAHQAPRSMGLPRQEYWSGLPCPLQGIFLTQRSNPGLQPCRQSLYWATREAIKLIPVYLITGGNKASKHYKILPFEVRQSLKLAESGRRLYLCYMFCVWTLGRFKCIWSHSLCSGCNWGRQTLLRFFLLLLITHHASELPVYLTIPECPHGAGSLLSYHNNLYQKRKNIYIFF